MARPINQHTRYREIEKHIELTVVWADSSLSKCPICGDRRLIFHSHLFRENPRQIADLCKSCTIQRAGGEERLFVREEAYLRRKWDQDTLQECRVRRSRGGQGKVSIPGKGVR